MNIAYQSAARAIQAAAETAAASTVAVSIAVVDTGGHLVAFARLESVCGVIDFAIKKARTAVAFGLDSDVVGSIIAGADVHGYGMLNTNGGLLTLPGGIVLEDTAGRIVGAIGVSGGTIEQDKAIAAAGAAAVSR